jgi:hypothetical protein
VNPHDFSFAKPGFTLLPRIARRGERLWTLTIADATKHTELRNGFELQIFHDGEIEFARRYEARELALEEPAGRRRDFEALGLDRIPMNRT